MDSLKQPLRGLKHLISKSLTAYLDQAYAKPLPGPLSRAAFVFYHRAHSAAQLIRQHDPGHAELWQGQTAAGQTLTVAYICDGAAEHCNSAAYLRHLLFASGQAAVQTRGQVKVLSMARAARRLASEADLVIVERNDLLHWRPRRGPARLLPLWIHMLLELPQEGEWQQIEQQMAHHANNIRRVRRSGFTYRFSRDPADFDLFYQKMLLPTLAARFHEYGESKTQEELAGFFQNGGMLMIDDCGGRPVAGGLMLFHGRTCYAIAAGVLDGSDALYKQGAMSAVYYYRARWCFENGYTALDAGGCRAFASDGIYTYKRLWGFQPVADRWNTREWLFWAPSSAAAALQWLAEHPPVELPFL